jgi:hypothetical protein
MALLTKPNSPKVQEHPDAWIIVGLFYPPRQTMGDLFDEAAN